MDTPIFFGDNLQTTVPKTEHATTENKREKTKKKENKRRGFAHQIQ